MGNNPLVGYKHNFGVDNVEEALKGWSSCGMDTHGHATKRLMKQDMQF